MKLSNEVLKHAACFYLKDNTVKETVQFIFQNYGIKISCAGLRKRLKKLGILRDNVTAVKIATRKHLPIEEIIKLYTKDNMSLKKLAKKFHSTKLTMHKILEENEIRIRGNYEAIKLANTKHTKEHFSGNQSEKYYMIGLVRGDLTPQIKSKHTVRITVHTTVDSLVKLVKNTFQKYGPIYVYESSNEMGVTVDLDNSFMFLYDHRKDDDFIANCNPEQFFSFLSGFIDTDGSVILRKTGDYYQYVIRVYNQNLNLLKIIKQKLESSEFKPNLRRDAKKGQTREIQGKIITYNRDYYVLEISNKKDCIKLLTMLNLRHKDKIHKKRLIQEIDKLGIIRWEDIKEFINPLQQPKEPIDTPSKKSQLHARYR